MDISSGRGSVSGLRDGRRGGFADRSECRERILGIGRVLSVCGILLWFILSILMNLSKGHERGI